MEIYFKDFTQVDKESANCSVQDETTDVNKENFYWNNKNTKLLLHLFEERKTKFRDPKIKKKILWTEIADEFRRHNYTNVTEDILDRKMRNMKKTYRTIKDNQKLSGRGRITWETFEDIFYEDKTINTGPTLSSMQYTLQPFGSEKMTKQLSSRSSDNRDFISGSSRLKTLNDSSSLLKKSTPSYETSNTSSQDSSVSTRDPKSLSKCSMLLSKDLKSSSIESSSLLCHSLDSMLGEHESDPDELLNIEEPYEKGNGGKFTSRHKPYSMTDSAVRSRAQYKLRCQNEDTEKERVKEITELRKVFQRNNEIQENRNKLLQDLIEEFKTSKK